MQRKVLRTAKDATISHTPCVESRARDSDLRGRTESARGLAANQMREGLSRELAMLARSRKDPGSSTCAIASDRERRAKRG